MRESNKSKLMAFARLWAVPMVLFVLLSIAAVVAAMNDSSNWMGAAVVGTVVMLLVQIAQLVSAIIVRRWWYVAGAVIGLAVSTFVFLTSVTALAAGQWPTAESHDSTDSSEYAQELFSEEITCRPAVDCRRGSVFLVCLHAARAGEPGREMQQCAEPD